MTLDWMPRDEKIKNHGLFKGDYWGTQPPCVMYDKKPLADRRSGVDLDPRDGSRDVGNEAAEDPEIVRPEPVGEVMEPDGVEARVAEEDLEHAARGGVPLEDDLDVVPDRSEHRSSLPREIIRPNKSIIRHFHKKRKDFLQPFLLDPLDAEKVLGGAEPAEALPYLHHGGGDRAGDPGQLRDF